MRKAYFKTLLVAALCLTGGGNVSLGLQHV